MAPPFCLNCKHAQDYEHGPNYLNFQDVSTFADAYRTLRCRRLLLLPVPCSQPSTCSTCLLLPPPCSSQWPGRKWKVGAWIIALVSTGVGIPAFAVWWQQSKLKG
jgi:hypothetical protein